MLGGDKKPLKGSCFHHPRIAMKRNSSKVFLQAIFGIVFQNFPKLSGIFLPNFQIERWILFFKNSDARRVHIKQKTRFFSGLLSKVNLERCTKASSCQNFPRLTRFWRCSGAGSHGAFQQMMAPTRHGIHMFFGCVAEVKSNTNLGQHLTHTFSAL